MHLEINRSDIRQTRMADSVVPTATAPGQVVMRLDRFALTSNNVSYAMSGDLLDYWGFFPTEAGFGRLPTMGYGIVTESTNPDIAVGGRYFGFFPVGDFHIVQAEATRAGFIDNAPHRESHAMAYRSFDKVSDVEEPHDDAILVLRGLFVTSFLAEDFIRENDMFGARQVIVTSASSKTSIALAHCLRENTSAKVIALTSAANVEFTHNVDLYNDTITYDDIESLDPTIPTVLVDMAGNSAVIARVHNHFDNALKYSCKIGATHWEQTGSDKGILGPKPEFFFAPSQMAKRSKEWGRESFNERIQSALSLFLDDSTRWLTIEHSHGADAVTHTYNELVQGLVRPESGHILSF